MSKYTAFKMYIMLLISSTINDTLNWKGGKQLSIDYSHLFELMKEKGLTTYRIRKEKIISETTLQKLREGKVVTTEAIDKLCCALNCQPGDIMEYIPEDKKEG